MANSFAKRRYARGVVASAALAVVALAVARRKGRSVGRCRTVIAVQRGLCPNALPLRTGPAARRFCHKCAYGRKSVPDLVFRSDGSRDIYAEESDDRGSRG